jgi:hypothetical protein
MEDPKTYYGFALRIETVVNTLVMTKKIIPCLFHIENKIPRHQRNPQIIFSATSESSVDF